MAGLLSFRFLRLWPLMWGGDWHARIRGGGAWGGPGLLKAPPPPHPVLVTQTIFALQFNPSKAFQKQLHVMLSTQKNCESYHVCERFSLRHPSSPWELAYPNIYRVLECPAVTSAEGSVALDNGGALKTFRRATMGEERLVGLALMQCHRQPVTQLDQDQLVHTLARRQPRRMDPGEHLQE